MTDEERAILDDLYSRGMIDNALRPAVRAFVVDPAWSVSKPMSALLHSVLDALRGEGGDIKAARQIVLEAIEAVDTTSPLLDHFIELLGVLEEIAVDEGLV